VTDAERIFALNRVDTLLAEISAFQSHFLRLEGAMQETVRELVALRRHVSNRARSEGNA
jgi:hypothetical protein